MENIRKNRTVHISAILAIIATVSIVGLSTIDNVEARELSIGPLQIEKLPEWKVDKQFNVEAVLKNSQMLSDNNGHNLTEEWKRVGWKTNFSQMGLALPPESDPTTRNQSDYLRVYDGACWRNLENDEQLRIGCRQMTALVANEWQGYFQKDIGNMMYTHPTYTNFAKEISPSDVLHERAQACSNIDKLWQRAYPPHHSLFGDTTELRTLIEEKKQADSELYIYLIENHLPQQYKDAIANHIENGMYFDLETGEQKLIHPDGINCNLG